jgi:aspartate/methionine/tyrosine aminotransferase
MVLKVARRSLIDPFIVMDVMRAANELAAAGEDVLHLEVGQPGTPAPRQVIAAAQKALQDELLGYTDSMGIAELRQRIARHYGDFYGVGIDPARVVVTTGSSGGFLLSFLSAFEPGDRVAMAAPGYPAYRNILTALGVEPVLLETTAADRFQPTPGHLQAAGGDLDGLILASPSNPTGTMVGRAELEALVAWCREAGVRLISDEIYHGITYGSPGVTAAGLDDDAIVINSFSKYFSMTGWRLGWMVAPEALLRPIECLTQNLFISPPSLSQFAGIAAFACGDELAGNVARYARNRAILLDRLPRAGFDRLAPADGAFYIYADVAHMTNDSPEFCRRMLAEAHVAATPGVDFDPFSGHKFVRFSFAGTEADMTAACGRLDAWRH